MRSSVRLSERVPRIHLYGEPSSKTLDLREISGYLLEKLGNVSVDIRKPLITSSQPEKAEELAGKLANTKIRDLTNPDSHFEPLLGEINFELRLLRDPPFRMPGVLYDGLKLQNVAFGLLSKDELGLEYAHIVFTNRLFGTWDEGDGRYHARVSVYGFPSLISTTGIVEAPAKPKEYYGLKRRFAALGVPVPYEELKEGLHGRFIDYDDERLTEVMKGYVMQALFYHIFSDPFCEVKTCRMFNSHWQEDLILSQLGPKDSEFCERHGKIIQELKSIL